MPIDLERLRRQRRYDDPVAGISEEFLEHRLGSGGSLALLSAPLADAVPLGWVVSPGPDHGNLRRLETLLARHLAASGFPTLRIRPDLHPVNGPVCEIDLSTRLVEAEEAVSALTEASGVRSVGLVGALSGGMVAAMVADRLGSSELALIEPVSVGSRYIRETIRRQAIAEVIASTDGPVNGNAAESETPESARPLEELAAAGETWVRGLRLTSTEYNRIAAVDLARDMRAFVTADRWSSGSRPPAPCQPGSTSCAPTSKHSAETSPSRCWKIPWRPRSASTPSATPGPCGSTRGSSSTSGSLE